MIVVFWLEDGKPEAVDFKANEMSAALGLMEQLRRKRRDDGAKISHVCMQSELVESVGAPGVCDPSKDYDWRKRRGDPGSFGRASGPATQPGTAPESIT